MGHKAAKAQEQGTQGYHCDLGAVSCSCGSNLGKKTVLAVELCWDFAAVTKEKRPTCRCTKQCTSFLQFQLFQSAHTAKSKCYSVPVAA